MKFGKINFVEEGDWDCRYGGGADGCINSLWENCINPLRENQVEKKAGLC